MGPTPRFALTSLALTGALLGAVLSGCGDDDTATSETASATELPRIVVTHAILGAIVTPAVGDAAEVVVLMPNGVDPHDFAPSAKDIEALNNATVIVANGLDLEEGLEDALAEAEAAGVPVFHATDAIEVREADEGEEHADEGEEHTDEEHDHAGGDPHFWTDPIAAAAVTGALDEFLAAEGIDIDAPATAFAAELTGLDATVTESLEALPADARVLVTGHESLGYFADRYGFELVGAIVPSLSTQSETTAAELAELTEAIETHGVDVVFTETGTPQDVANAVADETGATLVELRTEALPDNGSYVTFLEELTSGIVDALRA